MFILMRKLSDDVFEVIVTKISTTTDTVKVTDQSLTDLAEDIVTKA